MGSSLTFKKSWTNFTWSFTVNGRFAKAVRNLETIIDSKESCEDS
jgi:hypothetical protein